MTRDAGFQEEKYEGLYLDITWTKKQLLELVNKRIQALVRDQYTKAQVTYRDILVDRIQPTGQPAIEAILERTMMRPREVITFFNVCLRHAVGHPMITHEILYQAEGDYSDMRLRSLGDEWYGDYPSLTEHTKVLRKMPSEFQLESLDLDDFCLGLAVRQDEWPQEWYKDPLCQLALSRANDEVQAQSVRKEIAKAFYETGILGLKCASSAAPVWSFETESVIPPGEIDDQCRAYVHPAFYRALAIRPPGSG